ncbi:MAG TPA: hypothetical protein PLN69_09955 [bacterium]|nr:hypothetical protein [bacterium]
MKNRNLFLVTLSFALLLFSFSALADGLTARVNIALDDGTIMIYGGSKKGINIGDEFEVIRSGQKTGLLKITSVKELFSYCQLLEGDVQEMDNVVRVKKAPAFVERTISLKDTKKKEQEPDVSESAEDTPEKTSGSKRRESAKKSSETKDADVTDQKADNPPPGDNEPRKRKERTPAKVEEPAPVKKLQQVDSGSSIGTRYSSSFGLTGLIYMPSANVTDDKHGSAQLYYANSSDEDYSFKKDAGIGFTYGFNGNIEMAYTYLSSEISAPSGIAGLEDISGTTNILSLKYQMPNSSVPSFLKSKLSKIKYAVGLNYTNKDATETVYNTTVGVTGNATRFFAVATSEYNAIIGHAGLYAQTGDLANDDHDGIGIMGGLEYPLNRGLDAELDQMSIMLEADSKAYYLGTYRTVSLGLRYVMPKYGYLSLAVSDITSANILVFEGSYLF